MVKKVFAPGCGLMLYKPELVQKIHSLLCENIGEMEVLNICCHHDPQFLEETLVINICPGCDKRFGNDYKNSSTITLWEILAENDFMVLPDYQGKTMTINDACPTRNKVQVHEAIRKVIQKMNISLVEPQKTRTHGVCCGDSFYGIISIDKVKEQMAKRASEMPVDDVVVYCVSCIKSMYIGGKNPHYLIDLLFADETVPKTYEPGEWHKELENYIEKH